MALSGWDNDKKLILTIDSSNVDEDLTNFPVSITLSSGTGQSSFDATRVFDELGSDGNRKKIAVTDSDDNELYVEIERWDHSNEAAELWVKVPSIASGATTKLYLYYDSAHADNTTYVGDTGSTPAQNVWDSNFKAVYHMAQDPNGDPANAIKDSTSNTNHGTPGGSMTSADLVDGKIGKAIDFDGSGDYISMGDVLDFDKDDPLTLEVCTNADSGGSTIFVIAKEDNYNVAEGYHLAYNSSGIPQFSIRSNQSTDFITVVGVSNVRGSWHYIAATHDGTGNNTGLDMYKNGAPNVGSRSGGPLTSSTLTGEDFQFGCREGCASNHYIGILDEVRISDIDRSSAWIKATYYSNWNDFVTFSEPAAVVFVFSNPIPVDLSTVYGITQQLYLTTTVSGEAPNYIYNAAFYDASDNGQISSTVSGVQSGQAANVLMSTPSGINYQWYVTATSSGVEDTSDTYTFTNKFLCEGQVQVSAVPASGIPVRLYRRDTGEYIGTDTSAGVSGTFQIETDYNEYHYAIALYSATTTNAVIADWLIPQE